MMPILISRLCQTPQLALRSNSLTVCLSKIGAKSRIINNVEAQFSRQYHQSYCGEYNRFSTMPTLAKESTVLKYTKVTPDAHPPCKGSDKAAGFDLRSAIDAVVPARGKALIDTGLMIELPEGCYGRVAPRSGLAVKNFIDVGGLADFIEARQLLEEAFFDRQVPHCSVLRERGSF
ncbi:deoxyuridine 5'-triphosphate nucleotidohydrolase-like isoform X2 [Anthonomus grandis grandis]|uniref:deoxyuridine 5'-triphosphate nucleotidohydrolase-like isoform X2 n=1 Tax=Anthonomus grandis grandis TaxID=2921223 RepID=UPI00216606C1|nr:deoxyuridine 5'-triphosphate nucleotidohydrolase-like isoform X2 [Anthonomus grandis grandis]